MGFCKILWSEFAGILPGICRKFAGDLPEIYREFAGNGIFRLSVGIEDGEDLCEDLDEALQYL